MGQAQVDAGVVVPAVDPERQRLPTVNEAETGERERLAMTRVGGIIAGPLVGVYVEDVESPHGQAELVRPQGDGEGNVGQPLAAPGLLEPRREPLARDLAEVVEPDVGRPA